MTSDASPVPPRRRRRRATAGAGSPAPAPAPAAPEAVIAPPPTDAPARPAAAPPTETSPPDATPAAGWDAEAAQQAGRPPAAVQRRKRAAPTERGMRDLVGAGPSQLGVSGALRGRDVNRPTDEDLAQARRDLDIVRRNWRPDEPRR